MVIFHSYVKLPEDINGDMMVIEFGIHGEKSHENHDTVRMVAKSCISWQPLGSYET